MSDSVGPYRLLGRLGAGGMGEVMLAEDTRLGRRVALKSLTTGTDDAPEARVRLLHEARAAASLNHPNIAAIYDVLELDGRAFIVMEYVEGETLASRVARGPLSPDETVRVGEQLLDALAAAHAQGVVHRDLKPGNLVVTPAGAVKILDFGIARVQAVREEDRHAAETAASFTFAGRMVGTPGYSAPEQLAGAPIDARADLYAVGAILFELLTGRPAFADAEPFARVLAALSGTAPTAAAVNAGVPETLSHVVATAMAREPDARFPSAGAMAAALRSAALRPAAPPPVPPQPSTQGPTRPRAVRAAGWMMAAAVVVAAVVLAAWRAWPAPPVEGSPPSVAVLSFENLSGDRTRDFLGMGVAETISTTLAAMPALAVVSRTEVSQTERDGQGSEAIARALGVSYLVRGSVQQAGDQLGVNLQLVSASGQVMWGERFEGRVADLFDLQRRMAAGIGAALRVRTDGGAPADDVPASANPAALAEYWQGRILLDRRDLPGNVERAIEAFERAIDTEPDLALAHAGLGEAYWALYSQTRNAEWTELAIRAGLAAVRLAPEEPQARYSLAVIYHGSGRTTEAMEELRRVQSLRPNHVDAPRLLGVILAGQGRIDDAVAEFDKAIALRPGYVENYSQLGVALFGAQRYEAAEAAFVRVTELAPESARGFQQLGTLYQVMGDRPRALANYRASVARSPYAPAYSNIGSILYSEGRFADAADAYREAIALAPTRAVTRRNLGDALARLGDAAGAREAYQQAVELTEAELRVNPNDAQNLSRLAVYEAKLERGDDAVRHAAQAVALLPGDAAIRYRHAVVLALAGRSDEALEVLSEAVAAGYAVTLVIDDDDLASLRDRPAFRALTTR